MAREWTVPKSLEPKWFHPGNFTVCVLSSKKNNKVACVGVTKRNPNLDENDDIRAEEIALNRAIKIGIIKNDEG